MSRRHGRSTLSNARTISTCPRCGVALCVEGDVSPGRRRNRYLNHSRYCSPSLQVRERSQLADLMLRTEEITEAASP